MTAEERARKAEERHGAGFQSLVRDHKHNQGYLKASKKRDRRADRVM